MIEGRLREDETEWDMEVNEDLKAPSVSMSSLRPHELFTAHLLRTHMRAHIYLHADRHTL